MTSAECCFNTMKGADTHDLDGSGASGPAALDTVNVGTASVPNMAFGVCQDLRYGEGSSGTRDTDGPLGLGFGYGNSIRPVQQPTFMEALVPYVSEPVFGSAFRLDDSGFIDFGYSDSAAYTGELTTVPIANTSEGNEGAWVTQGVQFGSGGNLFSPAPMDLAFDSGTASLSLPADAASEYFALIPGSSDSSGSWTYPCSSQLPDFEFTFTQITSGPSTVTIPGDSLKNGDASEGDCVTWIDVVDGRGNAGLPFYINKYMIWNQAVPSLAFADQA